MLKKISLFFLILSCFVGEATLQAHADLVTISDTELKMYNDATKDKLKRAAKDGIFYLELSDELKNCLSPAIEFAHSFYKNDALKKLNLPGFNGYHDREYAQIESFYAECAWWSEVLPKGVQKFGVDAKITLLDLLNKMFDVLLSDVPNETIRDLTGNMLHGSGLYHLSFNHYRSYKKAIGVAPHKDFGYLSFIFIDKGWYAKINNEWIAIEPKKDHVIVFVGKAFETLVNDPTKCIAAGHYVEQIEDEQHKGGCISFGLTSDNNFDVPLYKMGADGAYEMVYENYEAYLKDSFSKLYQGHDLSF